VRFQILQVITTTHTFRLNDEAKVQNIK